MSASIVARLRRRLAAARGSSLVQSSLALMSGSVFSQAVFLVSSPVLTRVYGFADFGALANYNAWVVLLALIGVLRYDHAIIVAENEEAKQRAAALAGVLTVASSFVYAMVAFGVTASRPDGGYVRDILGIVLLIPAGVLFANLSSILNQWSIRAGLFRWLAIMAGLQALFGVALQVGLGLLEVANGLVVGALAGSVVYAVAMAIKLRRSGILVRFPEALNLQTLRQTAVRFSNFPRYALGADALGLLTLSFTPVLISAMFTPSMAGIFALAVRVVRLPMLVISSAIAGVLRKEAVEQLQRLGSLATLYKTIVRWLLAIGIVPCLIVLLFGPELFALVFGEQWSQAGRVVQILSPGILLEFVAFPLSTFFLVTDTQRIMLRLQVVGTVLLFGAIAFGAAVLGDFIRTCVLISIVMVVTSLSSIVLAWGVSKIERGPTYRGGRPDQPA